MTGAGWDMCEEPLSIGELRITKSEMGSGSWELAIGNREFGTGKWEMGNLNWKMEIGKWRIWTREMGDGH